MSLNQQKQQHDYTDFEKAIGNSTQTIKRGGLVVLQRNLSWVLLGAIAYGFLSSLIRHQAAWKSYFPPGVFLAFIVAAWVIDSSQIPHFSRQLRDIAIGVSSSQWLLTFFSSLTK